MRSLLRGYTLLELLVVLALMAFVTGLVAPAAWRTLSAARERGDISDIEAALASLPVRAFQGGVPFNINAVGLRSAVPALPTDWTYELRNDLHYSATGVASGGWLQATSPEGHRTVWHIQPVNGQPEIRSEMPSR